MKWSTKLKIYSNVCCHRLISQDIVHIKSSQDSSHVLTTQKQRRNHNKIRYFDVYTFDDLRFTFIYGRKHFTLVCCLSTDHQTKKLQSMTWWTIINSISLLKTFTFFDRAGEKKIMKKSFSYPDLINLFHSSDGFHDHGD